MDGLGIQIGNKIKELRKQKGVSLRTVGEAIGVDYSYISRIESGRKPSLDMLEKLAAYFEVPMDYLVGVTEEEKTFMDDLHLTPEELINKYELVIDGKPASKEEITMMINTIRLLRSGYKKEG